MKIGNQAYKVNEIEEWHLPSLALYSVSKLSAASQASLYDAYGMSLDRTISRVSLIMFSTSIGNGWVSSNIGWLFLNQ